MGRTYCRIGMLCEVKFMLFSSKKYSAIFIYAIIQPDSTLEGGIWARATCSIVEERAVSPW